MDVRLIRAVPARCLGWRAGPFSGMASLQKALRAYGPEWLHIESGARTPPPRYRRGEEIPWYWSWMDIGRGERDCSKDAQDAYPFVVGPNVDPNVRVMRTAACRLIFTHTPRMTDRYQRVVRPDPATQFVTWPYPIDPQPDGPLPDEYDLLIYTKGRWDPALLESIERRWPRSVLLSYGSYLRQDLYDAARRSRCCLYMSHADTGSLAQAETLLAGCPNAGTSQGSPWIIDGENGRLIEQWDLATIASAVEVCHQLDREQVRAWALAWFDPKRIVNVIVNALDTVRNER